MRRFNEKIKRLNSSNDQETNDANSKAHNGVSGHEQAERRRVVLGQCEQSEGVDDVMCARQQPRAW